MLTILGIESSCDDSSLAIVRGDRAILFHTTISQSSRHGGVVPEIASRAHLENLDTLLQEASRSFDLSTIDAVAVTACPGLIGGLMTGVIYAKTIASVLRKPIIAVNHLIAHALTIRLVTELAYPFLVLLVSGGNTQFLIAKGVDSYSKLGETLDDALGEAFDKVARMLGLGYPGGPAIERRALLGNDRRFRFPKPMANSNSCDFSFSGLKSEVARTIDKLRPSDKFQLLADQDVNDICASFQRTVAGLLEIKLAVALARLEGEVGSGPATFVLCGGVAANKYICSRLKVYCDSRQVAFAAPSLSLCGDNAAMIAWVGIERYKAGLVDDLSFAPCPKADSASAA